MERLSVCPFQVQYVDNNNYLPHLKKFNYSCSRNKGILENWFKMIYRWYLPPARLKKMYP